MIAHAVFFHIDIPFFLDFFYNFFISEWSAEILVRRCVRNMDDLTKDGQYLLGKIYEEYLLNINNGVSKSNAKQIGSSHSVHKNLVPNELFDDVEETMRELGRAGYLKNSYADNIVYFSIITDKTIVYMENKFKNNVKSIVDFLSKLK